MRVDNWTFVDTEFLTQSDSYKSVALLMPDRLFKMPVAHVARVVVYNGVYEMLRLPLYTWYLDSRWYTPHLNRVTIVI
jgi:hypothetical protein